MRFLDLDMIRRQLVMGSDEGDDSYLTLIADAAETAVEADICRTLYDTDEVIPVEDESGIHINDALRLGMLMMVGTFDTSREMTTPIQVHKVKVAYDMLIKAYTNILLEC